MEKTIIKCGNLELSFTDSDIANPDDLEFEINGNRGECKLWLLHDHGFTICVVCADSLQDAIDIACDNGKLDRYLIDLESESERDDYLTDNPKKMASGFDVNCPAWHEENGNHLWWKIEPSFLGNASEPFDIETLGYVEFALPKLSLVRLCGESVESISSHFA